MSLIALFRFFVEYEKIIYLILGIGAVFSLRLLVKAISEWRQAVFGLEKELTFQKLRVSSAFLIMFVLIALSQFCLVTFVVPFLPATSFLFTPTVQLSTAAVLEQPANTALPGETATAAPPPGSVGCLPGQLMITSPYPGEEVRAVITLQGTVNIPNFGFYKYEYAPQGSDQWSTIAAVDKIVQDDQLGAWDTSEIISGDYQLRLLVTDNVGTVLPPCIIPVHILPPP